MKSKDDSKRNIIQWIAFVIVILSVVIRLVLFVSGIARDLEYSTINVITWTGFAIGLVLLLGSFLFPQKT